MSSRAQFLLTATLWIGALTFAGDSNSQQPIANSRPNIVFILSDDHRYDALGTAGNKEIRTPSLDALANEGVHFTHAVSAVPICSPSRASLLTGMFPHQHGYWSNKSWSSAAGKGFNAPTAMELLRDAGYRTGLIGKWHLEAKPWKCGFTDVRTWMPHGADEYVNPKLARGKDDDTKERKGHVTEIFTDDAVEFLMGSKSSAKQQPFFLWLAYTAPHTPQKPVPESSSAPYRNMPADARPPGFPPGETKTGPWAQYYGAVTHLDEEIGRVLRAIDNAGLKDNTVVFFLGDNGWMMGSHGRHGKVVPEDESSRVPMIVRAPPGIQGWIGKTDALVSSIDLSATWLALAGVTQPEQWPGRSLLPLLLDQKPKQTYRDDVFAEFEDEEEWEGAAFRMVRTHEWKYILRPPRSAKELKNLEKKFRKMEKEKKDRKAPDLEFETLYDLKKDPHELKNVADEADYRNALEMMRDRMRAWMHRTNDKALHWMPGEDPPRKN